MSFWISTLHSLSVAVSMNSTKFLFVVGAFVFLGGMVRGNTPYPSELPLAPQSLSDSAAAGSKVDMLVTTLERMTGADELERQKVVNRNSQSAPNQTLPTAAFPASIHVHHSLRLPRNLSSGKHESAHWLLSLKGRDGCSATRRALRS